MRVKRTHYRVELRKERGMALDDIAERLAISRTTVFYWVKDLPIPQTEKQSAVRQKASDANRQRAWQLRMDAYRSGYELFPKLSQEPNFREFICMYIGEGYKRSRNSVSICNSDPAVVELGMKWIVRFSRNPVGSSVRYHADQSLLALRTFWSSWLDIEPDVIGVHRKSNSGQLAGRRWRSRHGVLTVRSCDTYFRAQLQAWMDLVKFEWG